MNVNMWINPGIKPRSPASQADSLPSEPPEKPTYKDRKLSLSNIVRFQVIVGEIDWSEGFN